MRRFAESLIVAVEVDGPIIVYGSFASTIIKGLIGFSPDIELPFMDILDRLVNLLPWLQNHYYHPDMKGSWSISHTSTIYAYPRKDIDILCACTRQRFGKQSKTLLITLNTETS